MKAPPGATPFRSCPALKSLSILRTRQTRASASERRRLASSTSVSTAQNKLHGLDHTPGLRRQTTGAVGSGMPQQRTEARPRLTKKSNGKKRPVWGWGGWPLEAFLPAGSPVCRMAAGKGESALAKVLGSCGGIPQRMRCSPPNSDGLGAPPTASGTGAFPVTSRKSYRKGGTLARASCRTQVGQTSEHPLGNSPAGRASTVVHRGLHGNWEATSKKVRRITGGALYQLREEKKRHDWRPTTTRSVFFISGDAMANVMFKLTGLGVQHVIVGALFLKL